MKLKFILSFLMIGILSIFYINVNAGNSKDVPGKITVYAEDGEKFTLYVNGVKQNTVPLATVEAKEVKGLTVKVNAVFANPSLAPVAKSIVRMAKDCSYAISKNKKGQYEINMKTAGTLGTSGNTNNSPEKIDSLVNSTIAKIDSTVSKPPVVPVIDKPSGTTTLAQTDPSKSQVMVNGRPADGSVKVDNATGKITLGAVNDKGEGGKITIDPSKLGDIKKGTGFHEPEVKLGGMTTDEFSNTMDKTGDAIGNSFTPQTITTATNTATNTSADDPDIAAMKAQQAARQADMAAGQSKMDAQMKETQDAATAAMNNAANHGPILPGTFTFLSEDGEKFTVFMDNAKQNALPQSNVVVNNILSSTLKSKIVFENTAIPSIEKKGIRMWRNYTFTITKNKKGEYVLKASGKDDIYGR